MIIFARMPGTTGWIEIKPEEELSHRGQFWEIRKFAVESDDALPLARRLDRAEQALRMAGFKYHGPSEKWLPPVFLGQVIADLEQRLAHAQSVNGRWARGMEYVGGLEKQISDLTALLPGNCYLDEPDGGSVTVLEQFKRMVADAAEWRDQQGLLRALVEDAQNILAKHLPPDDPSEEITLGLLYELLDGPRSREALPKLRDGSQKCPVCQGNDLDMPCAYPGHLKAGCLRDERLGAGT